MELSNGTITLRLVRREDAEAFAELRSGNREFMKPYDPPRPDEYFTAAGQLADIETCLAHQERDTGYFLGIWLEETGQLIGRLSISSVVRGAWHNANLGYYIGEAFNGKGYMTAALRLGVRYAFEELQLHRLQAAVMPWNERSMRVLEKVGFRVEGTALRYLMINGKWEDHKIFAMTAEELL